MLNSYVKKVPLKIVLLSKLFPLLEWLSPTLAAKEAFKLFFKPIRFQIPDSEIELRNKAEISYHNTSTSKIAVLKWVSHPDNDYVLLMHGWASRSTHFKNFINKLLSQNYNVICPEAPGHGLSSGKKSGIIEFANSIKIAHNLVKPKYWICHSMGGSSALYVMANYGISPQHLSVIATPAIAQEILEVFANRVGASKNIVQPMRNGITKAFGVEMEDYTAERIIANIPKNSSVNLVYDDADTDAPKHHGKRLKEVYPNAELHITHNLGHVKIIKDLAVLEHCQDYWAD